VELGLAIGVIGTGRLGREHVRVLAKIAGVDRVGCYDISEKKRLKVAQDFNATPYSTCEQLLEDVDAVSIVVPTNVHEEVALASLEMNRDIFLEKPIAATVEAAERIIAKAGDSGRLLQIGHIERFNAAIEAALPLISSPSFIEIERLGKFTLRGTDVPVVLDLMIHDLDLLLMIVGEWPVDIKAKGASVLTSGPDIVNVRLEFPNRCVANVTASRISMEASRKMRVFSPSRYLSLDLHSGSVKHYAKRDSFQEKVMSALASQQEMDRMDLSQFLDIQSFIAKDEEQLLKELRSFVEAVERRSRPPVTGDDGVQALKLATEIMRRIDIEPIS
jgi:predicted dehydrogenase